MAKLVDEKYCEKIMCDIGVAPEGIKIMLSKCQFRLILIKNVKNYVANIVKQNMLSIGGDVAVHRGCINCSIDDSDILLIGTVKQLKKLANVMKNQIGDSKSISREIESVLD